MIYNFNLKYVIVIMLSVFAGMALLTCGSDPDITYTVVYDKNAPDAAGTTADSLHIYGVPQALTVNGYTREGFIFTGWNTRADGEGTRYIDGAPVINLSRTQDAVVTLCAQWVKYSITTFPDSAVTLGMALIPAGSFIMGSPTTEPMRFGDDETQHEVTLTKSFLMGIYEVTQEQYLAVMGVNPIWYTNGPAAGEIQAKRPVDPVSWFEAIAFCNTLSALLEHKPVYSIGGKTDAAEWGEIPTSNEHISCDEHEDYTVWWNTVSVNLHADGYRLPTEAEWEYACRAGTTTVFNCGTRGLRSEGDYDAIVGALGWWAGNGGSGTHQAGLKAANAFGLYDMHGNVFEWCHDFWGVYTGDAEDPTGPETGVYRTLRGGGYDCLGQSLRSARRYYSCPAGGTDALGFRVVRAAP